jgi:hypothetical protein
MSKTVDDIKEIKSVGSFSNTTRAIKTAVAYVAQYSGCKVIQIAALTNTAIPLYIGNETNVCKDSGDSDGCTLRINAAMGSATNITGKEYYLYQYSNNFWTITDLYNATNLKRTGTNGNGVAEPTTDPRMIDDPYAGVSLLDDDTTNCPPSGGTLDADNLCIKNTSSASIRFAICD